MALMVSEVYGYAFNEGHWLDVGDTDGLYRSGIYVLVTRIARKEGLGECAQRNTQDKKWILRKD